MPSFEEEAFARAQQLSHSRPNGNQSERRRPPRENSNNRHHEPHVSHERGDNSASAASAVPPVPPVQEQSKQPETEPHKERREQRRKPRLSKSGEQGLLDIFFKDKERSIILSLLLLLMDESCDPGLLIALVYLLI